MKLSTKTRYGTRALVELAAAYGGEPISVRELAERQNLSEKYLEQIMAPLKAAGLVKSVRGIGGGYTLARPPSEVRLADIYHVLEGSAAPVDCVDHPDACPMLEVCPTRQTWVELKEAVETVLGRTTLQDLLEQREARTVERAAMYQI